VIQLETVDSIVIDGNFCEPPRLVNKRLLREFYGNTF